jgi:hypothetical protein
MRQKSWKACEAFMFPSEGKTTLALKIGKHTTGSKQEYKINKEVDQVYRLDP